MTFPDVQAQQEALAQPFSPAVVRQRRGMTYIPVSEVIARLNHVLGINNWSRRTDEIREHGAVETGNGTYPKWISARVTVSLRFSDGSEVQRDGWGGQSVEFMNSGEKGPVDLGDNFKGAASDAFKKACQSAGVGLDLARSEEAKDEEATQRQADEPKASTKACQEIVDHVKALPDEEKKAFTKWWNDHTTAKKLVGPDSGQVTVREIHAALDHLGIGAPSS